MRAIDCLVGALAAGGPGGGGVVGWAFGTFAWLGVPLALKHILPSFGYFGHVKWELGYLS